MDTYGINHERISDYGLRKVLGVRTPASRYFGLSAYPKRDSYISTRKKVKQSNCLNISIDKRFLKILAGIGAGVLLLTAIAKKKSLPAADSAAAETAKKGIFSKIKGLFVKK